MGPYVILPTSAFCGLLLPIAYVGWYLLNNKTDFLGADRPTGSRGRLYNAAMIASILTVVAGVVYSTLVGFGVL